MTAGMAVLHEIPGRVRVYYPDLALSESICRRISNSLAERPGILFVRVEPRISTVTVKYEAAEFSMSEIISLLASFQYFSEGIILSKSHLEDKRSFERAKHRSMASGGFLAASYFLKARGKANPMIDILATVYTGYTILSHGDREKNRFQHPDVITAFITSFTLGPSKMTEVALSSWVMNLIELARDYYNLRGELGVEAQRTSVELLQT